MSRFLRNSVAVFRGAMFRLLSATFRRSSIQCGKMFAKYNRVSVHVDKGGQVFIGEFVKFMDDSVVMVGKTGRLKIADGVSIGRWNSVVCLDSIRIGKNTILGPNVLIYDHDHAFNGGNGVEKKRFTTAPIEIGDNCWIGANAVILKGTKIGNRCVVGAGCVLKGSYPDDSIIIQKRQTEISRIEPN